VLYAKGRRDSCVVQPFPSNTFSSNSRSMYGTNSVMTHTQKEIQSNACSVWYGGSHGKACPQAAVGDSLQVQRVLLAAGICLFLVCLSTFSVPQITQCQRIDYWVMNS
jgi:hypothetical protein